MADLSQIHNGTGDNVNGPKIVLDCSVGIDVGRLIIILYENERLINELFSRIELNRENLGSIDETTASLKNKNTINDLTEFYERYIKQHEGKLCALDDFFKDQGYTEKIESAAENLRMDIFSRDNRKTDKLQPNVFNAVIQEHTKGLANLEHKDLMTLIIFYLYRFCYIGIKQ